MRKGWGNNNASPFLLPFLSRVFPVLIKSIGNRQKREQRLVLRNPLSEKALLLLVCSYLGETENGFIAMFPYDI